MLWRALKRLTAEHSEARRVITSVPSEDGWCAWTRLHRRFGVAMVMRQGSVLAAFSSMGTNKCKNPAETRSRITEIDRAARLVQEVTGKDVDTNHYKSVLIGCMDQVTRTHTAKLMGNEHTGEDLKNAVLEFTSSVVVDVDAMQLGQLGKGGDGGRWGDGEDGTDEIPRWWCVATEECERVRSPLGRFICLLI